MKRLLQVGIWSVLVILLVSVSHASTLDDGLIAYWGFENNTYDTLDTYNGTSSGTEQYRTGFSGMSYDSIGSGGNYIDFGDMGFRDGDPIAACGYVYSDSSSYGIIFGNYNRNAVKGFLLYSSTVFGWQMVGSGGGEVRNSSYQTGTWLHFCGSSDASGNSVLRINGQLVDTNTTPTTTLAGTTYMIMGCQAFYGSKGSERCFNGGIDEFAVWNRSLSNDEMLEHYNDGVGKTYVNGSFDGGDIGSDLVGDIVSFYSCDDSNSDASHCTDLVSGYNVSLEDNTNYTTGKLSQALNFDGSNDYANTSHRDTISHNQSWSYAGWVYPNVNSSIQELWGKGGISATDKEIIFRRNAVDTFSVVVSTNGSGVQAYAGDTIPGNEWSFLYIGYDYENESIEIVTNDVSDPNTYEVGQIYGGTEDFVIGARGTNGVASLNGIVDELIRFNRTLSPREVTWIKNNSNGVNMSYFLPDSEEPSDPEVINDLNATSFYKFNSSLVDVAPGTQNNLTGFNSDIHEYIVDGNKTLIQQNGTSSSPNMLTVGTDTGHTLASGQSMAWSGFLNATDSGVERAVFRETSSDKWNLYRRTNDKLMIQINGNFKTFNYELQENQSKHIAIVFDNPSDELVLYVDGVYEERITSVTENPTFTDTGFNIGHRDYSTKNWVGTFGVMRFWFDYNLTASQAQTVYLNDTGLESLPDTIAPTITGFVPVNGTEFNISESTELAINVTDDTAVSSAYVNVTYPNATVEQITLSLVSGSLYNNSLSWTSQTGNYTLAWAAQDSSGNNAYQTTWFNVTNQTSAADIVAPSFSSYVPSNGTDFDISQTIEIAVDITETNTVSSSLAHITWPNSTIEDLTLVYQSGNKYNTSFTFETEVGNYSLVFNATDGSGNNNISTLWFNVTNQTVAPIVGGDERMFINYTAVQNRSVCKSTALDSSSICLRTDTQSLVDQEFIIPMDAVMTSTDFTSNFYQNTVVSHYLASPFRTTDRQGINLPHVGFGDMSTSITSGLSNDYDALAKFACRSDIRVTEYQWRPDQIQVVCENQVGDTPNIITEARMAAVSKYGFIVQLTAKCGDTGGCNNSGNQALRLEHELNGNINPYELYNVSNAGGSGKFGLESQNLDSASSWMNASANVTFYIVPDITPEFSTNSGREAFLGWNLDYNEEISLTVAIVAEPEKDNINSMLNNPVEWIDNQTQVVYDYMSKYKVPNSTQARGSAQNMSRAIHNTVYNFYMSTVSQYGDRQSYYNISGVDYCHMSATGGYKGHWKWDGFLGAMGMASAAKENVSAYKEIQDSFDCIFEYQYSDGEVPQNVRDTYLEPQGGTYQAPGGWDTVVEWLCDGRVTNTTWCNNSYNKLVLEHNWFRAEADADADNLFQWGGVASGWDDSIRFRINGSAQETEALDLQGFMIRQAEAIENLSYTYNASAVTTFATYKDAYQSAAQYGLWDDTDQEFYDVIPSTGVPIEDGNERRRTPAMFWALFGGFANASQSPVIYAHLTNPNTLGESANGVGILPTLARNHTCFTDGETGAAGACYSSDARKWNGRNWGPPWVMAFLGSKLDGNLTAAQTIRDGVLETCYGMAVTQESYDSTDGSNPEEGSFAAENFPGFGGGGCAVMEYDWSISATSSNISDSTAPTLSIVDPTATNYSEGWMQINFSASDNVAVDDLWYNNGTDNVTYTTPVNLTFADGSYTYTFYANDTSNNLATQVVNFNISDTTGPLVSVSSPTSSIYDDNTVLINFSATDVNGVSEYWYFNTTDNVSWTSAGNISIANDTYTFVFYANDTKGNIGSTSVQFTMGVPAITNWTQRFLNINSDYRDGNCVLHWDLGASLYQDQVSCMEAYVNMWDATDNPVFLEILYNHTLNITARGDELQALDGSEEFRVSHALGVLAQTAYYMNYSGIEKYVNHSGVLVSFIREHENISERLWRSWNYSGEEVGALLETSLTKVRPINQQYGYALMNMYMYNLTGNATNYNRSVQMSRAMEATFSQHQCEYDSSLECHDNPYWYNFGQDFEDYTGQTFGFPPYSNRWNYGVQELEMWYRFWKHGFMDDATLRRMANSIVYETCPQEGHYDNVLCSHDWKYPGSTFSDFHEFDSTHHTMTFGYLRTWNSEVNNISVEIRNYLYNYSDNGDGTFDFYESSGALPYLNITDPRSGTASSKQTEYSELTPHQLLKHISVTLMPASEQIVFKAPPDDDSGQSLPPSDEEVTPPSGGGGGGSGPSFDDLEPIESGIEITQPAAQRISQAFCPYGNVSNPLSVTIKNPTGQDAEYRIELVGIECEVPDSVLVPGLSEKTIFLEDCLCPATVNSGPVVGEVLVFDKDDEETFARIPVQIVGSALSGAVYLVIVLSSLFAFAGLITILVAYVRGTRGRSRQ